MSKTDQTLKAVEAIYDAASANALWPAALQAISERFDAAGVALQDQRDDGTFAVVCSPGLDAATEAYIARWWEHDIRAQRALENGLFAARGFICDVELTTPEERRSHPFYKEFLAAHQLGPSLAVMVAPSTRHIASLGIQRRRGAAAFSAQDIADARRVGQHVERALRLSQRIVDGDAVLHALGETIARARYGVAVFDEEERVIFANRLINRYFAPDVKLANRQLVVKSSAARSGFEAALSEAIRYRGNRPRIYPVLVSRTPAASGPIALHTIALGATIAKPVLSSFHPTARAVVIIASTEPGAGLDTTLLEAMFGLTTAEAELAALVAAGMSPKVAGKERGIAEDSARTVLKKVFGKVGVSSQSQLAAMLGRLVFHVRPTD